jgi:hypothetical protein
MYSSAKGCLHDIVLKTPVKADSSSRAKTIHRLQEAQCRSNTPRANSRNASMSDFDFPSSSPISADGKQLIAVVPRQINSCHGRVGLEKRSCECYGVVKKEYDRLLPVKLAS